jgi:hypothetical protein
VRQLRTSFMIMRINCSMLGMMLATCAPTTADLPRLLLRLPPALVSLCAGIAALLRVEACGDRALNMISDSSKMRTIFARLSRKSGVC